MIYRIVNRAEVEQGIREAAAARAFKMFHRHLMLLHAGQVAASVVDREADLAPTPPKNGRAPWQNLPPFERERLQFLALSVLAMEISSERERMLDNLIDGRAEQLRCSVCGGAWGTEPHDAWQGETGESHNFSCPHGKEVALPAECIMDHPEIVP